ncbi:hypothetical protein Dimus_031915, partial [Dionaea muscipula]
LAVLYVHADRAATGPLLLYQMLCCFFADFMLRRSNLMAGGLHDGLLQMLAAELGVVMECKLLLA